MGAISANQDYFMTMLAFKFICIACMIQVAYRLLQPRMVICMKAPILITVGFCDAPMRVAAGLSFHGIYHMTGSFWVSSPY
eukprot:1575869-Pleurochrysis_carterae.AAC.2